MDNDLSAFSRWSIASFVVLLTFVPNNKPVFRMPVNYVSAIIAFMFPHIDINFQNDNFR